MVSNTETTDEEKEAAEAAKSMKLSLVPILAPLCAVVLVLVLVVYDSLQEQHVANILRSGTAAKARIDDIRPTGNIHNDQPEVTISMQVQPPAGDPFAAKCVTFMSPVYLPRFQPGAVVDVRFDPKQPSDVALVPP